MWGDIKIWAGSEEITLITWYKRFWRWITRANSKARYERIAHMMQRAKDREKQMLVESALHKNAEEIIYGREQTTGSNSGGQRHSTTNLRELTPGSYAGLCDGPEGSTSGWRK